MTFKNLISNINEIHNTLQIEALQGVNVNLIIRNYFIGHYMVEYEQNRQLSVAQISWIQNMTYTKG
jgi:hypothetical protein